MKLAIEFYVNPSDVPMASFPTGVAINEIKIRPDREQFIIDVTCPNNEIVKLAAWALATSTNGVTVGDVADFIETWAYSD